MRAAVLSAPGDLKIQDVPVPSIASDEVLIKVVQAGICATDLEVYKGEHPAKLPLTMGHEYSGVVEKVGEAVKDLNKGDPVTSEASWGCGACSSCLSGRKDKCQSRMALGRSVDGAFAEFVRVPASIVHKLPQGVSHDEGHMVVNLACVCRAVKRAEIVLGDRVVIIGSGQAGLLMVQVLRISGVMRVGLIGGSRPKRLELAQNLGADEVIAARTEAGRKRLIEMEQNEEVDVVFEASGSPDQLQTALRLVKPGGKVVVFSIFSETLKNFEANLLYFKEPIVCGSRAGGGFYQVALNLMRTKKVLVTPLTTHKFPLEEVEKGFQAMINRDPDAVRILVKP